MSRRTGPAAGQQDGGDGQAEQQMPELHPVAAFPVGGRLGDDVGGQPVQVGLGGGLGIARQCRAPGVVDGADLEARGLRDGVGLGGLRGRR
jgi:hypothetical protein